MFVQVGLGFLRVSPRRTGRTRMRASSRADKLLHRTREAKIGMQLLHQGNTAASACDVIPAARGYWSHSPSSYSIVLHQTMELCKAQDHNSSCGLAFSVVDRGTGVQENSPVSGSLRRAFYPSTTNPPSTGQDSPRAPNCCNTRSNRTLNENSFALALQRQHSCPPYSFPLRGFSFPTC